jgi:hypothetical protein
MPKVNISSIAQDLQMVPPEWSCYFDKKSGEVVSISDDALVAYEDGSSKDEYTGDGDFDSDMKLAREICKLDGRFVGFPSKFDMNEYRMMRDFACFIGTEETREALLRSIQGSGAFRRFRAEADRRGLTDEWYKYRDRAYERAVREWAESNGLEVE